MKAWRLTAAHEPLVLTDVPEPVAGPGEVVIDVKAASLCHSDVGFLDGTLTGILGFTPITLGHEIAGVVSQVGEGVDGVSVGERVGVPTAFGGPGQAIDGGFAEKVKVGAEWVLPLPDGISFEQAAPATDAGMTAYHALKLGGVTAGTKLGIIGAGGLGSLAIQFAVSMGAEVYVAEINEAVWPTADTYGAKAVAKDITAFADQGLQVVVDYAGFGTTTAGAIDAVAAKGTVVQVGLGKERADISAQNVVFKEVTYVGSSAGTHEDCAAVMDLIAQGKAASILNEITFDEIGEGVERLQRGGVVGRLVAVLP
ncbi:zinc-binding dehydrogenase [Actinacidiphila acididurans]|uniref:alcohol dehydrogenase n=1 Tax=Actinacidiphila acididurans TaxID=2784346 RepID=A0ABS2U4W3_9ACTN|nr:zinc-binding dehydrogenase [Actinacidiphila acididurans]MBM9510655.1 zinc-binding dehydrogenase [Actinacidiphila acididurans]